MRAQCRRKSCRPETARDLGRDISGPEQSAWRKAIGVRAGVNLALRLSGLFCGFSNRRERYRLFAHLSDVDGSVGRCPSPSVRSTLRYLTQRSVSVSLSRHHAVHRPQPRQIRAVPVAAHPVASDRDLGRPTEKDWGTDPRPTISLPRRVTRSQTSTRPNRNVIPIAKWADLFIRPRFQSSPIVGGCAQSACEADIGWVASYPSRPGPLERHRF